MSALWDSGDRIDLLWSGGVLSGIYADDRNGGRIIAKTPHGGPEIYEIGEFGKCSIRAGVGASWGTPLDQHWEALHTRGAVDDTTLTSKGPDQWCRHGSKGEGA